MVVFFSFRFCVWVNFVWPVILGEVFDGSWRGLDDFFIVFAWRFLGECLVLFGLFMVRCFLRALANAFWAMCLSLSKKPC